MSTEKVNVVSSFPVAGVIGILFITLKVLGVGMVANWSWLWVLSPFWIPFAVAAVIIAVALFLTAIVALMHR